MPRGIYKHKPWTDKQREAYAKAFSRPEVRAKMSASAKARGATYSKGDFATANAFHFWLRTHFGHADHCELCGENGDKPHRFYHWANISNPGHLPHQYSRKREDYMMLCASCHRKLDQTTERTKRQSDSHKGKKLSNEQRAKISYSMRMVWQRRKLVV